MTEKYEFPEEFRLITDEPIEDDGWGEFSLDSDGRKAGMVINGMAEFVVHYHCLLAPNLDIDEHISTLVRKCICPIEEKRGECPCGEAASELQRDGYSSCGIFVTEQYLSQSQYADQLPTCKEKTKELLKAYIGIAGIGADSDDSGIPATLAYHGFRKKHLDVLSQKAKTSSYWAKTQKFLFSNITMHWRLTTVQVNRLERIKKSLEKHCSVAELKNMALQAEDEVKRLRARPPKLEKHYSIAELEKMALEAESEAARLRNELPKYDVSSNGKESEKEE